MEPTHISPREVCRAAILAVVLVAVLLSACVRSPSQPSPTPTLVKEWEFQNVTVAGSTVTLDLRVFAGIDVKATLGGQQPDEVQYEAGMLRHVFRDVGEGSYTIRVQDVMGFSGSYEVVVPPP